MLHQTTKGLVSEDCSFCEPVRSGSRLVMITFIESQVPDPLQRDLLYSLGEVRALEAAKMEWRTRTQLDYVFANLHRMWSR